MCPCVSCLDCSLCNGVIWALWLLPLCMEPTGGTVMVVIIGAVETATVEVKVVTTPDTASA